MRFKYRKIRIHVVKSVLAQPVPYTLGTSKFKYVHMELFSITWNQSFGLH
jgi:hypothetical protein